MDFRRMRFLINRLPMARYRLQKAWSQATRITPVISDMPHGSGVSSPVENGYLLVEAAKNAVDGIEKELADMRAELKGEIGTLENPLEVTAMQMRYLEGRSVREIAYSLNYSEQHIFRVISRAEWKINKIPQK